MCSAWHKQQQAFSPAEVAQFSRDFVDGNVPLPPRFRERGPEFSWNAHALGWWKRLGGRAAHSAFVDFDVAMGNPVAAVEQLQRYCGNNTNNNINNNNNNTARPAGYDAQVIASRASRELASRGVASSSSYPNTAAQAEYHFPSATFVIQSDSPAGSNEPQRPPAWADDFFALPVAVQELFNGSNLAWDVVRRAGLLLPATTTTSSSLP